MTTGANWARRYGPNRRRLCARPGCGAPAAATLRFQPTQREAWLVDLEDDAARTEGDLCARHAAGLVLPRGWQLHNGLTNPDSGPPRTPPPAPRPRRAAVARAARRRRVRTDAVELPGLSAVADAAPVPAAVEDTEVEVVVDDVVEDHAEVVEQSVTATAPAAAPLIPPVTAKESEALSETLDAQTPLLRRAFKNVFLPEDDS